MNATRKQEEIYLKGIANLYPQLLRSSGQKVRPCALTCQKPDQDRSAAPTKDPPPKRASAKPADGIAVGMQVGLRNRSQRRSTGQCPRAGCSPTAVHSGADVHTETVASGIPTGSRLLWYSRR